MRAAAIAGVIALAIVAFAAYRIATGQRITLPRQVAWSDAAGKPFAFEDYDRGPCSGLMDSVLVLGDRLIVPCTSEKYATGYAWIEPRTASAKVAWPLPDTMTNPWLEGIAARDADTFAVCLAVTMEGKRALVVGVAGKDGWTIAPTRVATYVDKMRENRPLVVSLGWIASPGSAGESIDGAIELVLTHPTDEDPFGQHQPADVVRIAKTGEPIVTSRPYAACKGCRISQALPGTHGWKLIVVDDMAKQSGATLIDEAGAASPAPPALQWSGELGEDTQADRTAIGTLWGFVHKDSQVMERDGTRHPPPPPPVASWEELAAFHHFEWDGSALRRRGLYSADSSLSVVARSYAGKPLFTASQDERVQFIGDSVEHLHPVLQATVSDEFKVAVFLPAPNDGLYWVISDGSYVTLDRELRRTDPRGLLDHLRTRGSTGDFIDEPVHVVKLFVIFLAIPAALLLAAAFCLVTRAWRPAPFRNLLIVAAIVELWAFVTIAPLL